MSRVIVQVSLLSGRYHAHPWGEAQHAMAGPEWPPSPWRLLRGLAAAWFDANPHPVAEPGRDDLLEALGRAPPPAIWLPPASFAEIPYYQPIVESKEHKRALHYDHFAVLAEGDEGACFCFEFDIRLSAQQQSVLERLLARMTYLGRAESRAQLSLVEVPSRSLRKVTPAGGNSSSADGIRRRVLVTRDRFCAADLWADGAGGGHLVQALVDQGRRLPLNTAWIDYELPPMLVRSQLLRRRDAPSEARPRVAAVHFGLFRRVPIPLSDLVRVARELRDQAAARFEEITRERSPRLTGRKADGGVATGHQHAFWLPEPDTGTAYLQSCTVWLPDGAGGIHQAELDSLLGVQRIFRDDDYPILLVVERVAGTWSVPRPSRRWRSLTPFLAPRHSRRGRRDFSPAEQLRQLLEQVTGESPRVKANSGPGSLGKITPVQAHLYQPRRWRWTRRAAAWFELTFDHEVCIPRPLGTDSHFGLGRFVPLDEESAEG